MLVPASFAMASKKTNEECNQELNKRMHTLVGYHEDDCIGSDWVHEHSNLVLLAPTCLENRAVEPIAHDGDR